VRLAAAGVVTEQTQQQQPRQCPLWGLGRCNGGTESRADRGKAAGQRRGERPGFTERGSHDGDDTSRDDHVLERHHAVLVRAGGSRGSDGADATAAAAAAGLAAGGPDWCGQTAPTPWGRWAATVSANPPGKPAP
jgi:hypothetical protein